MPAGSRSTLLTSSTTGLRSVWRDQSAGILSPLLLKHRPKWSGAASHGSLHGPLHCIGALAAVGETAILLHPPLLFAGVSTGMWRGRQQNDSLADGYSCRFFPTSLCMFGTKDASKSTASTISTTTHLCTTHRPRFMTRRRELRDVVARWQLLDSWRIAGVFLPPVLQRGLELAPCLLGTEHLHRDVIVVPEPEAALAHQAAGFLLHVCFV